MAGPLHHHLRRDSAGEGESDEGTAAGMGAYHFIFRERFLDPFSTPITYPCYGSIEPGQFAKTFKVTVHQLVRNYRQGLPVGEIAVLVLLQDFQSKAVEIDGKPVVSLLGGYAHRISLYVSPLQIGHIGITQAGEGAEAEHVPGPGQPSRILDGLLIFPSIHILQLHNGTIARHIKVIEVQQLFFGQVDDWLFKDLELGPVAPDSVLFSVFFPECPIQEPSEIVELLENTLLLKPKVSQVDYELIDARLIEEFKGDFGIECGHMVGESLPALERGIGPAVGHALLGNKLLKTIEESYPPDLCGDRFFHGLHFKGHLKMLLDFLLGRFLFQINLPLNEMVLDIGDCLVDDFGRDFP